MTEFCEFYTTMDFHFHFLNEFNSEPPSSKKKVITLGQGRLNLIFTQILNEIMELCSPFLVLD